MAVTLRRNFGPLVDTLKWTKQEWRDIGDEVVMKIRRRTLAGQDAQGQAFAGYSAGYAKRKGEALGVAAVNLQVSGEMLNAMQVIGVTDKSVTIGWVR